MPQLRGPGGRFIRAPARGRGGYGLRTGVVAALGGMVQQALRHAKSYSATKTRTKTKSIGESKPRWNDSAVYDGRFIKRRGVIRKRNVVKRVAKYKRPSVKGENYYATYGATSTLETTGATADQDVLYIGHTAHVGYESLILFCCAMLRNLLKAGLGYEALDLNEVLNDTVSLLIQIHYVNEQTGVSFNSSLTVPSGSTLWSLSSADEILGLFARWSENSQAVQDHKFQWIGLFDSSAPTRCLARLDLTYAKVDMFAKSELKIQNRTTSNSTDVEVTDVNAVPLVGRQYSLPGCCPEVYGPQQQINVWDQFNGMTLCRAADINVNQGLKEPPPSKVFRGCTSSSKIRLEPGAIKSDWVVKRITLPLHTFLRKLGFNADAGSSSIKSTLSGSSLIALEKVIGVFGSPNISLHYECNFWQGIVVKHGRPRPALSRVASALKYNMPG